MSGLPKPCADGRNDDAVACKRMPRRKPQAWEKKALLAALNNRPPPVTEASCSKTRSTKATRTRLFEPAVQLGQHVMRSSPITEFAAVMD